MPIRNDPPLPLYWWRSRENLGDLLSPVVVSALSGLRVVPSDAPPRLIAIGSVLQIARAGDVVWGAGFMMPDGRCERGVGVRAVRGPLTRARLAQLGIPCPEVYGDPAILMPRIYRPKVGERRGIGVIPHYVDDALVRLALHDPATRLIPARLRFTLRDPTLRVISVLGDPFRTIDAIASCEAIVSTSLHGIIVAEAYGVPAAWAIASQRIGGGEFKFRDYYQATGRDGSPVDWRSGVHVGRALDSLCSVGLSRFDLEPLLSAFPFSPVSGTRVA